MRRPLLIALVALMGVACFGPDPNLTAEGAGLPTFTVSFPERSAPGSVQTAVLEISNPGPQDMSAVVVAFARVGPRRGGSELPEPIVDGGFDHRNPSVEDIRPRPREISQPATEFFFEPLAEGGAITIEFDLRVPEVRGEAANSVTVYDGADPDRIRGARLWTDVR